MNRRNPQMRVAVVPVAEGEGLEQAVLRKSSAAAVAALEQGVDMRGDILPLAAGFLAGFARQQALKHGVDAELDALESLRALLSRQAPDAVREAVSALSFAPRAVTGVTPRAACRAVPLLGDAGYILGHLESLCGTRRLLRAAVELAAAGDVDAFLTACDVAADRMQTHQPTLSLRLDSPERAIMREAFAALRA